MKKKSRTLGWLGVGAGLVWMYYTYANQRPQAVTAGFATIGLTAAHIFTAKA